MIDFEELRNEDGDTYALAVDPHDLAKLKTQLAQQANLIRQALEVVRMVTNTLIDMESIHPDGLPAKYLSAYEGMLLVGPEAVILIPALETALERAK